MAVNWSSEMKQLLRQVMIAPPIEDYVVRCRARHAAGSHQWWAVKVIGQAIHSIGSSPRGAQAVILGAKGNALAEGGFM